jgi:predicted RNA-binding protein (TIGR00451 family)
LQGDLRIIRSVADYQFGSGVGAILFPEDVAISFSRRTGRIRYVLFCGKRLATMRPTDGLFSLSIEGARRITMDDGPARCFVTVRHDVSEFIAAGGDVFAVHVLRADVDVRAKDEVIVVDETGRVLAVGRAVLSGDEMKAFKRGVAVKVRRGVMEERILLNCLW